MDFQPDEQLLSIEDAARMLRARSAGGPWLQNDRRGGSPQDSHRALAEGPLHPSDVGGVYTGSSRHAPARVSIPAPLDLHTKCVDSSIRQEGS
ncbi:hypothetical protein [Algiphilus sp.]|uniref:hypothetical protein n=1 Tax=Algiphilus sp. TaxID=1872431 RepID=UPI001CA75E25|nr:hypothetical protein [Algiphilus sp.]MBY8964401.1 hypothetical protein [Algiphilus acroporae]MCI5063773.1 hypothetical protein [Algiphilus sp.]MCI5103984.1 hypothetical protein [Algiphilus sp.]MCK5771447.1 hypothetical protein [Algiphilus sp.]